MEPNKKQNLIENPLSDAEQEKEEIPISYVTLFVKVGIIVLSIIMIIGLGIKVLPDAVTVSNINSKRDLPIYCVDMKEKKVSLSFDAAWGNEDIKTILDILAKYDVKATFFMTGEWVSNYPEDVKAIAAAGHDLANHGESHKQMSQLSSEECLDEIMKVHDRVKKLTGVEMKLFRPPYGDYNNTVVAAARECGYYTILWDIDSLDWKDYGADSIINKTVDNKKLSNGSIIMMHNDAKYLPDALERVILGLQEKGYELVPVSKLIYTKDYKVDQSGRQYKR
jgi:peptidoglycan-N-acetylglucosamine deacetylase